MVNKIIKNGTNLMFQRQSTILSAAAVLMIMSAGIALLGLIKLHLLSGLYVDAESKLVLDAFKAAFRIPDLIFQVLVVGALNAAFIPVFGELISKKDTNAAWTTVSSMINTSLVFFAVVAAVVFVAAEPFVHYFVAPDFSGEKLQLTADLTRALMISPILLAASAFLTGSIQVHHRFMVPALAPLFYNLGIIAGILWLYPEFGVWGLVYGVLIGSVFHLAVQIPMARHLGFRYQMVLGWRDAVVQRISKLMLPRTIGLGIDQLELLVAGMLVSTLGDGAFFLFTQVFSLIAFPISFIAVSISQASLPTLTKEVNEDINLFRQTLLSTFNQIMYLVVPIAVLMVVLKLPITRMIFNFPNWTDTLVVAQVLLVFAPAIVAQSAIHLWVRGLYALQDTVSPLTAGAIGVITSVVVSIAMLSTLGMRGIALGMVAGGFVTLVLLMYFMFRKIGGFSWSTVVAPLARILFAGAIMAVAVYLPVRPMESVLFDTSRTIDLVMLSIVVGGFGLSLYLFVTWILGSAEIVLFIKVAHKLRKWREAFVRFPQYEGAGISSELPGDS